MGDAHRLFRSLLLLPALVLVLAACQAVGFAPASAPEQADEEPVDQAGVLPEPRPDPEPTPAPVLQEPEIQTVPELPAPAPFEPLPGEVFPEAKRLAAHITSDLTTYPHGSAPEEVAEGALGIRDAGAAAAELVDPEAASAGTVIYAQMGGATPGGVSVMVLVQQVRLHDDGTRTVESRTVDVRLARDADGWRFAGLASNGGPVTPRPPQLPAEADAVLDHPRIHLSDSARWDIHRGHVYAGLLDLLLAMADHHEIHVLALSSGHPWEVFGTERQSNHTRGLAADIYAIDGMPVIQQRDEGSPAHRISAWLYSIGVPELGSPWAFDGFRGRSFTDVVHQDHLHVAVRPG